MNGFENFLIDKGYQRYILDCKDMKYKKSNEYIISTMVNLDHRYIHNSDFNLLDKINKGKSVIDKDFTFEDRKNEIVFGLHEMNKPVTLIYPRPRIKIKKENILITEEEDDAMNIVLKKVVFEEIFKAMYNKSICFYFDLKNN